MVRARPCAGSGRRRTAQRMDEWVGSVHIVSREGVKHVSHIFMFVSDVFSCLCQSLSIQHCAMRYFSASEWTCQKMFL